MRLGTVLFAKQEMGLFSLQECTHRARMFFAAAAAAGREKGNGDCGSLGHVFPSLSGSITAVMQFKGATGERIRTKQEEVEVGPFKPELSIQSLF